MNFKNVTDAWNRLASNGGFVGDSEDTTSLSMVPLSGTGKPSHDLIVTNIAASITGQINFTWSSDYNGGLGIRTVRLFPIGAVVRYVVNPEDITQGASQLASIADTPATAPVPAPVVYRQSSNTPVSKDDGLIISDEPIVLICAVVESGSLISLRAEAN